MRRQIKDLQYLWDNYPDAMVAWDEVHGETECNWPVMFFIGRTKHLYAEDGRCFSTFHKETCMCYYWDQWKLVWEKWIK